MPGRCTHDAKLHELHDVQLMLQQCTCQLQCPLSYNHPAPESLVPLTASERPQEGAAEDWICGLCCPVHLLQPRWHAPPPSCADEASEQGTSVQGHPVLSPVAGTSKLLACMLKGNAPDLKLSAAVYGPPLLLVNSLSGYTSVTFCDCQAL